MTLLRIAVIGAGAYETSRARSYLETISKLTDYYTLCAICDHSRNTLKAVGERFVGAQHAVPLLYTDVEKMLTSEKPDVVFVLVPTDGQSVMALTAANHKANIITEIPIAITLAIADAIIRTCQKNGVKYEIAENVWLWPYERLKRKIVEAGLLGEITHARLWYASGSYHGFNAIRMILGSEPKRVMGCVQSVEVPPYTNYGGQPETTRVWESGSIEFENGVICLYEMPPQPGARGSHWDIEGTHGYLSGSELVLYQNGNRVRYPFREVYETIDGVQVLSQVCVDTEPPIVWENSFKQYKISSADDVAKASILRSMYRAVTEGIEPEYGAKNARRDMELWFALRERAIRDNTWVDLPLTEITDLEHQIRSEYVRKYGHDPVTETDKLLAAPFDRLSVIWTVAGWL